MHVTDNVKLVWVRLVILDHLHMWYAKYHDDYVML